MRGVLEEFPPDRKHTRRLVTDLTECTLRQVNGISVFTSGTFIRHGHDDTNSSYHVGDVH
jgi:hypothetical protein